MITGSARIGQIAAQRNSRSADCPENGANATRDSVHVTAQWTTPKR